MSELIAAVAEINKRAVVYRQRKIIQKTVLTLLPITLEVIPLYLIALLVKHKENRRYYREFTTFNLWNQIYALSKRIQIATLTLYSVMLIVSITTTLFKVEELKLGLRFIGFFYTFTVLTIVYMHHTSKASRADKRKAKLIVLSMLLIGVVIYIYAKGYLKSIIGGYL